MTKAEALQIFRDAKSPDEWQHPLLQAMNEGRVTAIRNSFSLTRGFTFEVDASDGTVTFCQPAENAKWIAA